MLVVVEGVHAYGLHSVRHGETIVGFAAGVDVQVHLPCVVEHAVDGAVVLVFIRHRYGFQLRAARKRIRQDRRDARAYGHARHMPVALKRARADAYHLIDSPVFRNSVWDYHRAPLRAVVAGVVGFSGAVADHGGLGGLIESEKYALRVAVVLVQHAVVGELLHARGVIDVPKRGRPPAGVLVVVDCEAVTAVERICTYVRGIAEELGVHEVTAEERIITYCRYRCRNNDGFQLAIFAESMGGYAGYSVGNYQILNQFPGDIEGIDVCQHVAVLPFDFEPIIYTAFEI